jgi:hypothetical protein
MARSVDSKTTDVLDDEDEEIYDNIDYEINKRLRKPEDLPMDLNLQAISDIEGIIEDFSCRICMDIVNNPYVIKHCLHFFCKECIDTSIRTL